MMRTTEGHVVRALTIAGSDSGGGAGIQADLKTMHQFGVYGMSVITALTAQNTTGVQGIFDVSPAFVRQQLESVWSDIGVDAVKTGMLANSQIIDTVARFLREQGARNLVVDPVMIAKGGSPLLETEAVQSLRHELLPLGVVVTPNLPEAEVLCGFEIRSTEDIHRACEDIAAMGPQTVVLKGGHTPLRWERSDGVAPADASPSGLAVDVVYSGGAFTYFASERVRSEKTHGTGCTFSSAITSMLAQGCTVLESIASAKAFIAGAISGAADWDVGAGHGPTDHTAAVPVKFSPEAGRFYLYQGGKWSLLASGH
ncbi:bifunctional hydroxymethylpyrimidine kinase/phosphomethylpyrimidine kinase [Alicyclobacillus curvatus]|nr:bifunctional hydroxymethylpyrimidine kinase/phosphomethylpyrimidine kinase [Alicyclobacillus curvatus]